MNKYYVVTATIFAIYTIITTILFVRAYNHNKLGYVNYTPAGTNGCDKNAPLPQYNILIEECTSYTSANVCTHVAYYCANEIGTINALPDLIINVLLSVVSLVISIITCCIMCFEKNSVPSVFIPLNNV